MNFPPYEQTCLTSTGLVRSTTHNKTQTAAVTTEIAEITVITLRLLHVMLLMLLCSRHAGVYLTIVMAMTSVSVITAVFVLNLHYRGPDRRPVPQCLRRLVTLQPELRFTKSRPRLHGNDWTLTMTVETLATELSRELDTPTVSLSGYTTSSNIHRPN